MENKQKLLKDQVSSDVVTIPPKRRKLSSPQEKSYLYDDTKVESKVSGKREVLLPVKKMVWKPFMACKVVPSTKIKYISDDESDSEVIEPKNYKKDEEVPTKISQRKFRKNIF